jgi:cobalt-zinc-cadmium efflux system membrane fusion protein
MSKQTGMIGFIVFLLVFWAGFELACTKSPQKKSSTEETLQKDQKGRNLPVTGIPAGRGWMNAGIITLTEEEKKAVEIKTFKATLRPMRSQLRAMGKVLAPQTKKAIVSYAFPARVADIHVLIGDWVKAGQKLVTLQSEEVGKARAEFFKARVDLELARRNLERDRSLFERGVGAHKNLLSTEAEFKVAEASLDAAEKKLHVLGFTEEQVEEMEKSHQVNPIISLNAPISGKIIQSNAVRGAMVDQNTEILTIMDPTVLWVDAEIYERDIARIKIGQEVSVSVPAYPDETFSGKISFISDVLKEDSRTITVRTEVDNKGQKLKPGMFADVTIYLNHQARVLALPEEAILDDGSDKIIFVCADSGYRPQPVQVGTKEAGFWEIRSGLEEGEEVVTAGNYQLKSKMYQEILRKAGVH